MSIIMPMDDDNLSVRSTLSFVSLCSFNSAVVNDATRTIGPDEGCEIGYEAGCPHTPIDFFSPHTPTDFTLHAGTDVPSHLSTDAISNLSIDASSHYPAAGAPLVHNANEWQLLMQTHSPIALVETLDKLHAPRMRPAPLRKSSFDLLDEPVSDMADLMVDLLDSPIESLVDSPTYPLGKRNRQATPIHTTTRKPMQKRRKCPVHKSRRTKRNFWTQHEDELLIDAVENKVGFAGRWFEVSQYVSTRTAGQCSQRWRKHLRPEVRNVNNALRTFC